MPTLDEFVADLSRTGLVARDEIKAIRASFSPEQDEDPAVRFAKILIDRGLLTRYQARKVLAGATKGFFLGDYRIERRLGAGGMGKVYLAKRGSDGAEVAIKVLPPRKALEKGQALERFKREMSIGQRLNHPNIARTLDVGEAAGVLYIAMEYVPGLSLFDLVRSPQGGPLKVTDAARIFTMVAEGLDQAHAIGLVHRDVKPSNLMVTPEGDAKILDLGLAKDMEEANPLTSPNTVIGTLDYASPEQLGNAARADVRSDLYSVGCTIYFALTGRAPFEGGDVVNKIYKQRMEDPPPLERVSRGCPVAFAAIVRKLMAKDPAERYQTAKELAADLSRWTDPELIKKMLGESAAAAKAFRPPPILLDEDDLKLLPDDGPPVSVLRELGNAEPSHAPMHRGPAPPRTAHLVSEAPVSDERVLPAHAVYQAPDSLWLTKLMLGLALLGIVAIILKIP
jgi:serine/threonine protein kinase